MFEGELAAIYVTDDAGAPMVERTEATLVPGVGIEGDRYALGRGTYSGDRRPGREVTLVEEEAVAAVVNETGVLLTPEETRRNLVTRGVPLNHLVGHLFHVGDALLEGVRLCEPCEVLERIRPGSRQALVHRGGLRAVVVEGGTVRVSDPVRLGGD